MIGENKANSSNLKSAFLIRATAVFFALCLYTLTVFVSPAQAFAETFYHDGSIMEVSVIKDATQDEEGLLLYKCPVCGLELLQEIPRLGHAWQEWYVVDPAGPGKEGYEMRECSNCGKTEYRPIPALSEDLQLAEDATTQEMAEPIDEPYPEPVTQVDLKLADNQESQEQYSNNDNPAITASIVVFGTGICSYLVYAQLIPLIALLLWYRKKLNSCYSSRSKDKQDTDS